VRIGPGKGGVDYGVRGRLNSIMPYRGGILNGKSKVRY
jgi:hypothetical protein